MKNSESFEWDEYQQNAFFTYCDLLHEAVEKAEGEDRADEVIDEYMSQRHDPSIDPGKVLNRMSNAIERWLNKVPAKGI